MQCVFASHDVCWISLKKTGFESLLPSGSEQHEVLLFGSIERNTSGSSLNSANKKRLKYWYSWV